MRKLFAILALLGAVGWCAPVLAQDKPAAPAAAPTASAPAAAAPSATAAPAPTPNKGDVA
jgi:Amt family ammonium transporter